MLTIWLLIFTTVIYFPASAEIEVRIIHEELDQTTLLNLNRSVEYIILYRKSTSKNPYRINVSSRNATKYHPLLVVVRQEKDILSWQVPLPVESTKKDREFAFHNTSRTLCHNNMYEISQSLFILHSLPRSLSQSFIVSLSTSSITNVDVTVEAMEEINFFIKESQNYSLRVSPSEPRYVFYQFDSTKPPDTVMVEIDSEDDICLTISIQNCSCPVFDLNKDIKYEGKYQTINRKGGMIIKRKQFPMGFFLVFVAKADNYECSQENSILPMPRNLQILPTRSSIVTFKVSRSINQNDYVLASLVTLASIGLFYIFSVIMVLISNRWGSLGKIKDITRRKELDEELIDDAPVSKTDIEVFLEKSELRVNNLARHPVKNKRRSFNYLWHINSIAIFYSIPVVQLVITYQRVVNQTGNEDMCYYNFMCAHPAWYFSDFNHIFSNIGYVLIGILYLMVVVHKHSVLPIRFETGIPVHYGLFYAMGVALIIEGLLSACYHICPSQSNYQFDTSFMYVMAVLCMVKLYQNRHPDINATAYATFTVLGFTIFMAMLGILNGSLTIWIIFVVFYSILCIYISFKIYFFSYILDGISHFLSEYKENGFQKKVFAPVKKGRFCLLLAANAINYAMLISGLIMYERGVTDFGTFLLGLLMGNAVLYAIFYTVMKLYNREKICMEAICYGVLGTATWITATVFFLDYATLWTVTPAESRLWNQHCILLDFYDKHDVWHLLSAPALYFSFMFLLCLDDDLVDVKQEDIKVF